MTDLTMCRVLEAVARFEQTANAGYGRYVGQAWLELYPGGSGWLIVELCCGQNETCEQKLFSNLFPTTKRFEFKTIGELMSLLSNGNLLASTHPEVSHAE